MNQRKLFFIKGGVKVDDDYHDDGHIGVVSVVSAQSPSSCYQCWVPGSPLYGPTISLVTQPP